MSHYRCFLSGLLFTLTGVALAEADTYRYPSTPFGNDSAARKCVVCHSLEKNGPLRSAPNLWGIIGAPKARTQGYGYSVALAKADGVWTEEELSDYLNDPDKFMPGTKKTISGIPDDQERADIIDYLKTLHD